MICSDLAQMVATQGQCINALDGKYQTTVTNSSKAKDELHKFHQYQEKSGKKLFAVCVLLLLVGLATLFVFKPNLKPSWKIGSIMQQTKLSST